MRILSASRRLRLASYLSLVVVVTTACDETPATSQVSENPAGPAAVAVEPSDLESPAALQDADTRAELVATEPTTSIDAKYGWVVLGPQGAIARAVVDTHQAGKRCPTVQLANRSQALGSQTLEMTLRTAKVGKPNAFQSINVCEVAIPQGTTALTIAGRPQISLQAINGSLTNTVVIGDTGCRSTSQNCDTKMGDWKFPQVAKAAALEAPELLLHVGDYHYREVRDTGCKTNVPDGDCWHSWELDFFEVAQTQGLLGAAPWIFARGNHETCKTTTNRKTRAWRGWFLLLDPRPLETLLIASGKGTPPASNDLWADANGPTCNAYSDPYEVQLSGHSVWVMDSSGISSRDSGHNHRDFEPQFKAIDQSIASSSSPSWLLLHHPIWATSSYGWLTESLAHAWESAPTMNLEQHVEMVFAGHIHLFEQMSFTGSWPTQFVFGGGGTSRDRAPKFPGRLSDKWPFPNKRTTINVASYAYTRDFDYGVVTPATNGWQVVAKSTSGQAIGNCASRGKPAATCSFSVAGKPQPQAPAAR